VAVLAAGLGATPATATSMAPPEPPPLGATGVRVTVAFLPRGIGPLELSQVDARLAPGIASSGLGRVPANQSYLDMTQGARVWSSLYGEKLPRLPARSSKTLRIDQRHWRRVIARARAAPAEIVPGLLAAQVREASGGRLAVRAALGVGASAIFAADRDGRIERLKRIDCAGRGCPPGVNVVRASLDDLPRYVAGLRGRDLLIAIERPPRAQLAIGIAGAGFGGNLTSDSTRTAGYVTATDLAPTILARLGLPVPAAVEGRLIRSEGRRDPAAVRALERRFDAIPARRGPAIRRSLAVWLALVGALALAYGARAGRLALPLLALSAVYLPALLLLAVALDASRTVEVGLVMLGGPALAALTLRLASGYAGLAVACAVTVGAHLADLVAGSPLTSLSLLGPNPGLGARFYGIGNELEAALVVLVLIATAAGLVAWAPRADPRTVTAAFLGAALLVAAILAPGRFGADVGAAISLPAGAMVAGLAVLRLGRRRALALALAVPLLALAALAGADLVAGGDAHLSRSVLEAGGLDELADVAERRLRLSARSFARPVNLVLLGVVAGLAGLGLARRRQVAAWFAGRPAARAGFIGALAATVIGGLTNDSGALLLIVGAAYLALYVGFAWSQAAATMREPE